MKLVNMLLLAVTSAFAFSAFAGGGGGIGKFGKSGASYTPDATKAPTTWILKEVLSQDKNGLLSVVAIDANGREMELKVMESQLTTLAPGIVAVPVQVESN